jgi:hypothetical protein
MYHHALLVFRNFEIILYFATHYNT